MRASTVLFVLAMGSVAGVAAGFGANWIVPESPIVRGLNVGERRVPDRKSVTAWLAARRDEARSRRVHFRYGERTFSATLEEAGVEIDVAATLENAERVGHHGAVWTRLREARGARRGEIDVPLVWFVDRERARALLDRFAPEVRKEPVDAKLDLRERTKIPEVAGQELDFEGTLARLAAAAHEDEETIDLLTHALPAKVTVLDLVNVNVDKVLSSYETIFATYGVGVGRSANIQNAVSKIDGTIIPAGAILSFNDLVGPRTLENGFAVAPEILGDELTNGVGGGTCQVSSTLHVAALYGALEIVERQSHSRPSAYTQMGLDATVSYPTVDLKIRNTMPFSIMVHAYLPEPTPQLKKALHAMLRVELLGGEPMAKVVYKYGVGHTENFTRRIYTKSFLPPGKRIRHQKGSRGYDITSVVSIQFFDGRSEERHYFSGYRPAPEVFWVAPGYDENELPPLPEHASGVEARGDRRASTESREGRTDTASM